MATLISKKNSTTFVAIRGIPASCRRRKIIPGSGLRRGAPDRERRGARAASRPHLFAYSRTESSEAAARDAQQGDRDGRAPQGSQIDVAFRVIADHIRTLSFAIADGIQPGNTDRNYVLRRILRRAVRYGRTLGFHEPFFYKLVAVLARTMGDVFPEIRAKQKHVEETLRREEEAFNKTLDRGIEIFERTCSVLPRSTTRSQWSS